MPALRQRPGHRTRRLAAGKALERLVRDTVGSTADTDDLAALIASRDAQLELVTGTMQAEHATVIDRGNRYTLALLGRTAESAVSPETAILNWAIATRREWRTHRQAATAPERTPR